VCFVLFCFVSLPFQAFLTITFLELLLTSEFWSAQALLHLRFFIYARSLAKSLLFISKALNASCLLMTLKLINPDLISPLSSSVCVTAHLVSPGRVSDRQLQVHMSKTPSLFSQACSLSNCSALVIPISVPVLSFSDPPSFLDHQTYELTFVSLCLTP